MSESNMKDSIIALAIVLAIWGIPFALGEEVVPYWENAFDFIFIPILIYVFFKGWLIFFLKRHSSEQPTRH